MNRLFLSILLIASIFECRSQDQIAKDILDQLSKTTRLYENIRIEFSFELNNKTHNINDIQNGVLELEKNKFRILMQDQIIVNDGATQWLYLKESNELQITENDPEENTMNPNEIFTIYEKGYKYQYIGKKNIDGKEYDIIDLFTEESSNFIKTTLTINSSKNQIKKISMQDKNGGTYDYFINKFESNITLDKFEFESEKYSEIEIIDLR